MLIHYVLRIAFHVWTRLSRMRKGSYFQKASLWQRQDGLIKDQCTASSYCSLYIGIDLTTNDYFSDDSNRSENSHSECHHIPSTCQIGMHVNAHFVIVKRRQGKEKKKNEEMFHKHPQGHTELKEPEKDLSFINSVHILNGKQHTPYHQFMSLSTVQLVLSVLCKNKNVSFKREM